MTKCDFCEEPYDVAERRVVALPNAAKDTLTAVMWGCGGCSESANLPTAESLANKVENGEEVNGRRYMWHSL